MNGDTTASIVDAVFVSGERRFVRP